jgi:hypothetical protein
MKAKIKSQAFVERMNRAALNMSLGDIVELAPHICCLPSCNVIGEYISKSGTARLVYPSDADLIQYGYTNEEELC